MFFFHGNFCGDAPEFRVNGKRGNCAQLEVGNRRVMPTVNVFKKRRGAHFTATLSQKMCLGSIQETLGDILRSLQRHF